MKKKELAEEIAILRQEVAELKGILDRAIQTSNAHLDKIAYYVGCSLAGVKPGTPNSEVSAWKDEILIAITGEMPF